MSNIAKQQNMKASVRLTISLSAVLYGLIAFASVQAYAETSLSLEQVLTSVKASLPKLMAMQQKQNSAQAKAQGSLGHWNPKLEMKSIAKPQGPFEYFAVNSELVQETPLWGAKLFAGYRFGQGEFPSYKDLKTLDVGEMRAGLELPLLKGRQLDEGRAEISKRSRLLEQATCALRNSEVDAVREASFAYWSWVFKRLYLKVQKELLGMAESRAQALKANVEHGSLPPIVIQDNERQILDRQAKVIEASRKLQSAMFKLSLYHRSPDLQPIVNPASKAPQNFPAPQQIELPHLSSDIQSLKQQHPLLCMLKKELSRYQVEVELAQNNLAPSLNIKAFVGKDLGEGPAYLAPTELGAAVNLKWPLGLDKAQGELDYYQATQASVQTQLRGVMDQLVARLQSARVDLETAYEQTIIAKKQVEIARLLVEAEQHKLEEGASDLVILNLRELTYGKAEAAEFKALATYHKALAAYKSARGEAF